MSQYSSRVLQEVFRVPAQKIDLIPDGIPDLHLEQPDPIRVASLARAERPFTFGLLP